MSPVQVLDEPYIVCLQESQSFACVLPVITVTVCVAVTSMGGLDPDHVLCSPIELHLEQAARVTACHALPVHTVTAQVRNTASQTEEDERLYKMN